MLPPTLSDHAEPDPVGLRPHTPQDVDDLVAMGQDRQTQCWTTVPVPYQRIHAVQFLESRRAGWAQDSEWGFAVTARDDSGRLRLAGNLDLRPDGAGGAGIGFALAPWARGRGVMSRAVRLALQWAFTPAEVGGVGLSVVRWEAHVGNWPSRRVAWATGFRVEGTVRGLLAVRGQLRDGWIGSVVRGDPLQPRSAWWEAAELRGADVRLRPWREDDVPRVVEACADPLTQWWLAKLPSPYTVADAQWYVRSREEEHAAGRGVSWCVAAADDDRCVGSMSLTGLGGPDPVPEIGYWAHPDSRGRGLTTQALRLAVRHAVVAVEEGGLGLPRVTLRAGASNAASAAVAVRAGMTRCGIARSADEHRDGSVEDFLLFDVLAHEVPAG